MLIIAQIFKSIISVIILNFFFVYVKYINKKKVFFFYHSESKINDISVDYINYFFLDNLKIGKTFFGYSGKRINIYHYFLIKEQFIRFLFNVDYFVTNYLNSVYPYKSKKIYIHHDIYDTPLVGKKFEKKVYLSLSNLDFIFISSKIAEKVFIDGFKKFRIKKIPKLLVSGYLKLAYLENLKHTIKNKKNNIKKIIIAPTQYKTNKNLSILNKITDISAKLLQKGYGVILRPHPLNRDDKIMLKIKKKFLENKNFYYDVSSNYFKTYLSSSTLITDISGTAYTYAFFTLNPVIFISSKKKEIIIKNNFNKDLNYFKNRNKIGLILLNDKNLIKYVNKNISNIKIRKSIIKEKKKIISGKKVLKRINYLFNKLI